MITVLPLKSTSSASVIASSEKLSSAEVGSSRRIISGFLRNIFAIASLCFCPHESLTPLSPICVSIHFLSSKTKSHFAFFSASIIFSSLSFSFISFDLSNTLSIFSLIEASKTQGSCVR